MRALVLVGAAALSLLAAEGVVRGLRLLDRVHPMPRELFTGSPAPDLPYRLRPGARLLWGDVPVRVNRLGLRGGEVGPAREGTHRILALGDSVVYGHRLREQDSFPVLLAGELGAEVLNGATPGYDTSAELAFLREVGLELEPDAVVLGVSLNDYGPAPMRTARGFLVGNPAEVPGPAWLADRSELYLLARWLIEHRGASREGWEALDRYVGVMHKRFYADPGPALSRVREALVAMRDLARAHGIALSVVIFPEKDQFGEPPDRRPQARWLALCSSLELRCLDLWPAFAEAGGESLFHDMQHPNAEGMRAAARAAAGMLAQ